MDIASKLLEHGGGAIVGQISKKFGLGADVAQKAVASLLPQFLSGVVGKAQGNHQFAEAFASAVSSGDHEKYIETPETLDDDAATEDGNKILGHVLESKDASREVAQKAAEESGIDLGVAKKALPLVAGMAMGALKKQGGAAALLGKLDAGDVVGTLKKLF